MWMNPTLAFTKCATSRLPARMTTSRKTNQRAVVLGHHSFADKNSRITRMLSPQPIIYLTACNHLKNYEEFGYRLHTETRQITISMTSDTGCQSGLFEIKIIHRQGFIKSNLVHENTKTSTMIQDVIPILGEVILRLSGKSGSGKVLETAQVCSVTDVTECCILEPRSLCSTGSHPERLQLRKTHTVRSATAPTPYAQSRHHN